MFLFKRFFKKEVGKDLVGNVYYEQWTQGKLKRWVVVKDLKDYSDFESDTLPAQWQSWLRKTRKHPPSLEELTLDQQRIEQTSKMSQRPID